LGAGQGMGYWKLLKQKKYLFQDMKQLEIFGKNPHVAAIGEKKH
jgi:hypothetical protein